jgi:flagellar basal body P-ring protein FlgI
MKPVIALSRRLMPRRDFISSLGSLTALSLGSILAGGGCSSLNVRSQSPDEDPVEAMGRQVQLLSDLAFPFGMNYISIEAVGLVTGLDGTGSDPAPSPQRAALIAEMQTRGVENPNQILASNSTELVMVRGYLRPGIQKGDHFDVEVRTLSRSECTTLRGGWLIEARLREMAVLGNQVREGTLMATAEGPVMVDPSAASEDHVAQCRGRILGGGVSRTSREMGLVMKPDARNVLASAQIGTVINRRFHTFQGGIKTGVAKPKTDEFIEIKVHPRYKDNIERYMRVIRALPLRESQQQQLVRTQLLERQLLDPITASAAALKLEALGKSSAEILRRGLESNQEEVRFYAAESLAYLDDSSAAAPLGQLARDVPAFRAYALAALSAMDDVAAYNALRELLDVSSAETRYGAFRSLWAMNAKDPLVRGESMDGKFSYHCVRTSGPEMVHVTRSYRPEVVLFGEDQRFKTPVVLEAGSHIMVTTVDDDKLSVSRFALNEPDQKRLVSTRVDDVIRAIVELGGNYPDVVQALQQAKANGSLPARFQIDAIPQGGRSYQRRSEANPDENEVEMDSDIVVGNPLPDLFSKRENFEKSRSKNSDHVKRPATDEKSGMFRLLFGKMAGRDDS